MKELGKRIRRRRLQLGLSLKETAAAANRSHGWLLNIERGIGNPPSEALTAIAVKLGDDPKEYLRLAGRVSLTAADVTPLTRPELPPGTVEAFAQAVREILVSDQIRIVDERARVTEYPGPPPSRPAPVVPIPTLRVRRKHWLTLAAKRGKMTAAQLNKELGGQGLFSLWRNGRSDPQGAQVRHLAELLDIPEALILEPPMTDEERLGHWHSTDGANVLREIV